MSENQLLFALFIDGDNVNSEKIQEILDRISSIGKVLIKQVYNNTSSMGHWEPIIGKYSLTPIWVPNNTRNKNSVDIALVVGAMSLLYERSDLEGFCIVSSDADYTALVKHIQTKDKYVLGIGNSSTPEAFRNACTDFVDLAELSRSESPIEQTVKLAEIVSTSTEEISDDDLLDMFSQAYQKVSEENNLNTEDGWIPLPDVKAAMINLNPGFQMYTRILAEKLKALAEASSTRIEVREQLDSKPVFHYVRLSEDREIDKFCAAYKRAATERGDKDGWVQLSAFGQVLQVLFSDFGRIEYKGVARLQKVIEKMSIDYPDIIELDTEEEHPKLRFKI